MPQPKPLHIAKSTEELNKKSEIKIPSATIKQLINAAKKIYEEVEIEEKKGDEEKAYILYMRYFALGQKIQTHTEYKKDKKYYSNFIGGTKMKLSIERAEELSDSLKRRYNKQYPPEKPKPIIDQVKLDALHDLENRLPKVPSEIDGKSIPKTNGVDNHDQYFIPCEKVFQLLSQKTSSIIFIDIRTKEEFTDSQIKHSKVINIPADTIHKGITATKIQRRLENDYRSLWETRINADHLIIIDGNTESLPLPESINNLLEAMMKWDPGKHYKSRPKVMKSGFEMWHLMYPMSTSNPMSKSKYKQNKPIANSLSTNLNFDYNSIDLSLDTGFVRTPSPNADVNYNDCNNKIGELLANNAITKPTIHRQLKPITDKGSSTNDESTNDTDPDLEITKIVNKTASIKVNNNLTDVKPVLPNIPSRSLKPKEILASMESNETMIKENEILTESLKIEKDTMEKLSELEKISKNDSKSNADKLALSTTVATLEREVSILKSQKQRKEEEYEQIKIKNKEFQEIINNYLNRDRQNKKNLVHSGIKTFSEDEDHKKIEMNEDKRKHLLAEVEELRLKRKEKEKKLNEEREQERQNNLENQKILDQQTVENKSKTGSPKVDPTTRMSRHGSNDDSTLHRTNKSDKDPCISKLRGSPKSSPVRGGSNLNRSHSAFNLSRLIDEEEEDDMKIIPNFDRSKKPLQKRRNLNVARQRNFEPKYGTVGRARTGLKNLGNTCYMNAIIQCLNNTTPLAKYFVEGTYVEDLNSYSRQKGEMAEEFGAVIQALWCGQYRSIAMWDLKTVIGKYHNPFHGYDQHDSHEFLIKLMDWLNEDLNKIIKKPPPLKQDFDHLKDSDAAETVMKEMEQRDQSVICSLFNGLHRSVIQCLTCGHRSLTFEPFSILTLSFPSNKRHSIKDMLNHYYKETQIDYKCSKCKVVRTCTRKHDVWKWPPILIIHLNRFEHDVLMKKKQNYVDFPVENLDLSNYTSHNHNRHTNFNLYGITNHYGTMDGGHYTGFCKSSLSNSWYKFDDHEVYELSRDSIKTSAAFILFYESNSINYNVNS